MQIHLDKKTQSQEKERRGNLIIGNRFTIISQTDKRERVKLGVMLVEWVYIS